MPRSPQTPVESRPLAIPWAGLLPSARATASALAVRLHRTVILWSTTLLISGLNDTAWPLTSSGSVLLLRGLHAEVATPLLARR
jgi:hypothetical protein